MGFKFRREGEPFIGGQDAHYWRWSWGEFPYGELGEEESGDFNKDRISWLLLERNIWLRSLAEIIDEEASLLDLGCGAGKIIQLAIDLGANPKKLTGLDLNSNLVSWCQEKWREASFVLGSCTSADCLFEPGQFDIVTANLLFNHLDGNQFRQTARASWEVLKPGGSFLYLVPDPWTKAEEWGFDYEDNSKVIQEGTPWGEVDYHHRTREKQIELICEAGFQLKRAESFSYWSFDKNAPYILHYLVKNGVDPRVNRRYFVWAVRQEEGG